MEATRNWKGNQRFDWKDNLNGSCTLGWETKGLKIPDWEINLDKSQGKKISIIMMLSGTGKTTTLNLLRYSFFDYSKIIPKKI